MRYLRLLRAFAVAELKYELTYRLRLLGDVFQMAMVVATSVGAVLILFTYTDSLNGWGIAQMLVLLGVYYMVQGLEEMVLMPSVQKLIEHVRLGTLDFTLLKPANGQFLVSLRHMHAIQVFQALLGVMVLGVGLSRAGGAPGPWETFAFVVSLACGLLLIYALLMVLATTAFWFVRTENILVLFWAFVDAGRFPTDLYPGWMRLTMNTIVPVGIAITVPAQAVSGRLDAPRLALVVAWTVVGFWFSTWFWKRGLRSYTGASA